MEKLESRAKGEERRRGEAEGGEIFEVAGMRRGRGSCCRVVDEAIVTRSIGMMCCRWEDAATLRYGQRDLPC
jgi:hypothetical protein